MVKVVFDTVVFVRSLLNPFSRSGRLVFECADDYTLVLSPPLIREILEVLQRPEITRKFRAVEDLDMRRVLDLLAQATIVELDDVPAISRDPKDDTILATADVGDVDYIVSEDRDLVILKAHGRAKIVDTETFLRLFEAAIGQ